MKRLGDLLQEQIQETSLLNQMLQKEREVYKDVMKQSKVNPGTSK